MFSGGRRTLGRRLILLGLVLAAGAMGDSALGERGAVPVIPEGGTLHVNVTGTDLGSLDPAINYDTDGGQLLYATCAKLVNYPDRPAPGGSVVEPEVASGMPTVSRDGRTYTFQVSPGFRFSNGALVRAADFEYTIRRDLDPRMHSPALQFLRDVVAYRASGHTLTLRLRRPAPDLVARLAMPFFCVVPAGTPIVERGLDTIPSAGPYYVAARTPGLSVTLKRNPHYSGTRPHHVDEIDVSVFHDGYGSVREIDTGDADYDIHGVPGGLRQELALRYGVNGTRFFAHPMVETDSIVLNTSRPLFRDASVRRAVAYAIDREALTHAIGFLPGKVTDQILPPAIPGYRNVEIYPFKADVQTARKLMGNRRATAVLYLTDNPLDVSVATVLIRQLARIHIDVTVKPFRTAEYDRRIHRRGEPFDLALSGWVADYLDPYNFINVQLSGRNIPASNNQNLSHFDDPIFNRRMEAAARLSGSRRYAAYARLDADLMRQAAPIIPYANEYKLEFVSKRTGCIVLAPGAASGLDFAAVCLKSQP
jgi:peptide/nickel transport system substrate-binding protein